MSSPRAQDPGSNQTSQAEETVQSSAIDGQDHDRMETDEESEGSHSSDSEHEEDTPEPEPEPQDAEPAPAPPPPTEAEAMDTSPDHALVEEPPPPDPPSQAISTDHSTETQSASAGLHLVHIHVPNGDIEAAEVTQAISAADVPSATESEEARLRVAERVLRDVAGSRAENEQPQRGDREAAAEEEEGDEESDDSSDEEEHPYWVNLKEDTSAPDDRELKVIEDSVNEVSALDHEHWERLINEPLDDPEYVPDAAGNITWTVKGVHGTTEKPNREKIMRSPSVLIGGYYWNIKYFPHGNDGTEQLSIYIECSPTPYEDAREENAAVSTASSGSKEVKMVVESSNHDLPTANINHNTATTSDTVDTTNSSEGQDRSTEDTQTSDKPSQAKAPGSWGIAAQIGCVLYNPEEPRVNVYQKGCHRYFNDSPDWGWTRFHGPWDEIHKRQRLQRQALLRNDTLAFTAYIRTINDDTKSLWWHPPKDSPPWDSRAMTGVPPFECPVYQSSAMVAAISAWLSLQPIRKLLRSLEVSWDDTRRIQPAVSELQDICEEAAGCACSDVSEDHSINLKNLMSILEFYGKIALKSDVVKIWETLRRVLNYEVSGLENVDDGNGSGVDIFKDVLLLKQPDPLHNADPATKYPRVPHSGQYVSPKEEPHSVQETLDKASSDEVAAFRVWQSFEGQLQEVPLQPSVLQVELHRQAYSKEARKWQKLSHRITIDESIMFNQKPYTLYGMIVHSGALESHEYYSVIRPEGPGTRWIKYAGDNHERTVTILTSKQAIQAHEGMGDVADGTAAVAYVVLYVPTADMPGNLCTPFKHEIREETSVPERNALPSSKEEDMMDSNDHDPEVSVLIYAAEGFDAFGGYKGRGICDPWAFQHEDRFVKRLSLPASITISQLKDRIGDDFSELEKPENSEIRLWPINTFVVTETGLPVTSLRAFPSLLSFKSYCDKRLDEIEEYSGGRRFWMKVANKAVTPTPEVTAPVPPSAADRTREQEARDVAIQAVMSSISAADDQANGNAQPQNGSSAEAADTDMAGTDNPHQDAERQRRRRQQQLLYQMQQAQQQQQMLAAQQAQQRQQEAERNAQQLKEVYFFVKTFDADTQSLRGMGSAIVKNESKIVEETKKLLRVDSSEAWDCYLERGTEIDSRDCVKAHETFESKCGGADGTIIIAQRRLSVTK